jgi:hypothetical protein
MQNRQTSQSVFMIYNIIIYTLSRTVGGEKKIIINNSLMRDIILNIRWSRLKQWPTFVRTEYIFFPRRIVEKLK